MSEDILSVVPTDPEWQPSQVAADRALELATRLLVGEQVEIKTTWHDRIVPVDCGENLTSITCPVCRGSIELEWYFGLLEAVAVGGTGFGSLVVRVPCCSAETSLTTLEFDWPCAFARFELEVWNPVRDWFTDEELAAFARALGHPVRQIRAHI